MTARRARLLRVLALARREWGGFQCSLGAHEVTYTEGAPGGCARCLGWNFRRPSLRRAAVRVAEAVLSGEAPLAWQPPVEEPRDTPVEFVAWLDLRETSSRV